jgi:hypothetical protein
MVLKLTESSLAKYAPDTWLGGSSAPGVDVLCEQIFVQQNGWATILLHAEMSDC